MPVVLVIPFNLSSSATETNNSSYWCMSGYISCWFEYWTKRKTKNFPNFPHTTKEI